MLCIFVEILYFYVEIFCLVKIILQNNNNAHVQFFLSEAILNKMFKSYIHFCVIYYFSRLKAKRILGALKDFGLDLIDPCKLYGSSS